MLRTAPSRIAILLCAHLAIMLVVFLSTGASGGPRSTRMTAEALTGQQVWQDRNCISCHAIYGLGGHIGPDLTNVAGRVDDETFVAMMDYGIGAMPPQELSTEDAAALVAYLRHIDETGVYPTRSFPGFAFGRTGKN